MPGFFESLLLMGLIGVPLLVVAIIILVAIRMSRRVPGSGVDGRDQRSATEGHAAKRHE